MSENDTSGAGVADADGFLWVGNHPCLDLVNTEMMLNGERTDVWRTPDDLNRWLARAGLADDRLRPDADALAAARATRAVARRLAEELADTGTPSPDTLTAINARLGGRPGVRQVVDVGDAYALRFVDASDSGDGGTDTAARVAARLAESAADLLCRPDRARVRRCENPRCILFFLDTSKNHARRWCSMGLCGNRAKAAAHYRRTRAAARP